MQDLKLKLKLLEMFYGVCRLDCKDEIPKWALQSDVYSITKTHEELSIVCNEEYIPEEIKCEKKWRILKVQGPLDFSLIGILSNLSSVLAQHKISIFAISTYDTDYVLVKENKIGEAIEALKAIGCEIEV
ncbi:ACT domain-containing protein [Clostridium sp. 'White wine YQ']|uniref:ACT domain-containing protein n=1 Tax=Clostridium sp. 'White wine YQ' TaxID=3027474 RepID=UPI002365C13D|nr:ACT domain-containing protein [Clostridium sp. 'White wine YQ']MDD7795143.1 ACT domain-containing protein [Clostridium sp. 'White wine YQ']